MRTSSRWKQLSLNERIGRIPTGLGRRLFERRYGVDVSGQVDLGEIGAAAEGRVFHLPSDWVTLRRSLRRLRIAPDDVIVDFGSGKGRVVLAAARYTPAKRVVGIEVGEQLHLRAIQNRYAMRGRFGQTNVEMVRADATVHPIPDDMTIAYLFSPFYGELMEQFVTMLLESVQRAPRALRVVYCYPFEHNRLIATGRFEPIDVIATKWPYRNRVGPDVAITYLVLPKNVGPPRQRYASQVKRRLHGAEVWSGLHDPGAELVFDSGRIVRPD